jgi:hypothetical protein
MSEVNVPNNAGYMGLYEYIDLQGDKHMRVMRIILSILICLCMAAALFPATAFAADTVKTIQSGTGGISDPTATTNGSGTYKTPNSHIYFGMNSGNNNTPIKWRVPDADKSIQYFINPALTLI